MSLMPDPSTINLSDEPIGQGTAHGMDSNTLRQCLALAVDC